MCSPMLTDAQMACACILPRVSWQRFDELKAILLEPPKGRTPNPYLAKAVVEAEDSVGR